jgi:hypothetical protein
MKQIPLAAIHSLGLSLLRNRGLAAKDILLDVAGGCVRQLGYEVNFLRRLEACPMITSVIGSSVSVAVAAAFKTTNALASIRDD